MMAALITNKNNPKVTIVAGNVRKTNTGFTMLLSKANNTATNKALI